MKTALDDKFKYLNGKNSFSDFAFKAEKAKKQAKIAADFFKIFSMLLYTKKKLKIGKKFSKKVKKMEKQKMLRPAVTAAKPLRSEQAKLGERSNEAEWRNRERRGIL